MYGSDPKIRVGTNDNIHIIKKGRFAINFA